MSFQVGSIDRTFRDELEMACNVDLDQCWECGKCTGGCTTAHNMDYTPRKIIQLIRIGAVKTLMSCNTPWVCVSCRLCVDRCPAGIDIPRIMDYLREKSLAIKDHGPGVDDIILFHKLLLEEVYKRGRVSATALALKLNMQTGQYFKDAGLGQKLLRKGKISPFSSKVRDLNKVRSFFKQEPDRREV